MYSGKVMSAAGSPPGAPDRLVPLLALLRRAARWWWAAMIVAAAGCLASVAAAYVRRPVYKSETLILYREGIRSSYLGPVEEGHDPVRKLGFRLKELVLSRPRLEQ